MSRKGGSLGLDCELCMVQGCVPELSIFSKASGDNVLSLP